MKTQKQHWSVITHNEWPAIQMKGQDTPFILFGNDTVLSERAASRWAETIAAWMNEQMRLGLATNKMRNCDAMLLKRLHDAEAELTKLNLENQELHSRLMKLKQAGTRATDALHAFRTAMADAARQSTGEQGTEGAGELDGH